MIFRLLFFDSICCSCKNFNLFIFWCLFFLHVIHCSWTYEYIYKKLCRFIGGLSSASSIGPTYLYLHDRERIKNQWGWSTVPRTAMTMPLILSSLLLVRPLFNCSTWSSPRKGEKGKKNRHQGKKNLYDSLILCLAMK